MMSKKYVMQAFKCAPEEGLSVVSKAGKRWILWDLPRGFEYHYFFGAVRAEKRFKRQQKEYFGKNRPSRKKRVYGKIKKRNWVNANIPADQIEPDDYYPF